MKFIFNRLVKTKNNEHGGVLILVAFSMVVILGMAVIAIDVGSLYQTRRQAVNAADAAALAGAQEMIIGGDVDSAVNTYAVTYNGADNYEILEQTVDTIKVRVEIDAPLWFYPAFASLLGNSGESSSLVSAEATALIYPPEGMPGLVPFAISLQSFITGDDGNYEPIASIIDEDGYTRLTWDDWTDEDIGPGNYGFVAFNDADHGDTGANTLKKRIEEGFPGTIYIGQEINTETGLNTGPVKQGVNNRIASNPLIFIPIIEGTSTGQSGKVTVVGFAAFILQEYIHDGQVKIVRGVFTETIAVGSYTGGESPPATGVYAITLIE